jgi:hypothetical protein
MTGYPQVSMDDVFAAALAILIGICLSLIAQQIRKLF